jgi:DNA topoisomerase VI subunit A
MAKKKKDFTGDPGGLIGDAIFSAIKPIYKEGEKQRRQKVPCSSRRTYYAPIPRTTQKDIVFQVLSRAIGNAGSHFSARDLYYATRPLAYAHSEWEDGKELNYTYFSQQLLTEYQEERGLISGLWRDPRGHLHEPRGLPCPTCGASRGSTPLGTREVANYKFPDLAFDKILYVEKEGEWPKLQAAKLAERYDMAVASAKGYPVEAVRELFSRAKRGGNYQLFVFHDADIDGYNIARVMREATRRMPYHHVDVKDIGLTVEDAVEMGLDPEPFSRTKSLPWTLSRRLSDTAREYFVDREERFELNAILPDTARIDYIERKLEENGVRGKVIPPEEKLVKLAEAKYRDLSARWVAEAIEDLISSEEFNKEIADVFEGKFDLGEARRHIEKRFKEDLTLSWREALEKQLEAVQDEHRDAFARTVEEKLRKRVREE